MFLNTFSDGIPWIDSAVEEIMRDIAQEKSFSLAFSGGSTPAPIYQKLAEENIDWSHGDVFQVDERFIAPDRPESNQLLIQENFEKHLSSSVKNIHYFETGNTASPGNNGDGEGKFISWEESAQRYNSLLEQYTNPLDVCILGIGPDGHTASLFPNEPAIYETKKLATTAETNQFAVWKRLTITFPMILASKKIIVLLKGLEKKEILEELVYGKKSWEEFPSKKLLDHKNLHIFFLKNENFTPLSGGKNKKSYA